MQGDGMFDQAITHFVQFQIDDAFDFFRGQQTVHGGKVTADDKRKLRDKLSDLSLELDRYLARDYGIDPDKAKAFAAWRESHQPFHWFAEFYGVMREGGFDVVIGNPPYVATRKITDYSVRGYKTADCTDIYAWCLERVIDIASKKARTGMIVVPSRNLPFAVASAMASSVPSAISGARLSSGPVKASSTPKVAT